MPAGRRFLVGVVGSGQREHVELAEALGSYLGRLPVDLVVGGGAGVMTSVACAFRESAGSRGLVLGILPAEFTGSGTAPEGYPNPWVDIPIRTHLGARGSEGAAIDSRNHVLVLSSQAVVALPGSAGTKTEIELCLRYGRPVIVFQGCERVFSELGAQVERTTELSRVAEFLRDAGLDPRQTGD